MLRSFSLVLLLGTAIPTLAGPVEDLSRLIRQSSTSPSPAMAFLRGLAALPDFDLPEADLARALSLASVTAGSEMDLFLRPTLRLVKSGESISISRRAVQTLPLNGATLEVAREVRLRLRVTGPEDAIIDRITGLKATKYGLNLTLREVRFLREDGRPVAKVMGTVGLLITSVRKTVTIDLTPTGGINASLGS